MKFKKINPDNLPEGGCLAINKYNDVLIGYIMISGLAGAHEANGPTCKGEETQMYNVTHYIKLDSLIRSVNLTRLKEKWKGKLKT